MPLKTPIRAGMLALVCFLLLPGLLLAADEQPDAPLFVCGQVMPGFVVDAQGIQLASDQEARQYLATQPFANETRVGLLYHVLAQLRLRGVQYRIWTDGGERSDSLRESLADLQDWIWGLWEDEPPPVHPTVVGIAYRNVYAEYWLDPTVPEARLAQYLITLYTMPCD